MKTMFHRAAALALSMTTALAMPAFAQTAPQPSTPPVTQPAPQQPAKPKYTNLSDFQILHTCTNNQHEFLISVFPQAPEDVVAREKQNPATARHLNPANYLAEMEKTLAAVVIKYSNATLTADNTAMAEASAALRQFNAAYNAKNNTQFNVRIIHYAVTETPVPECPARGAKAPAP